MFPPNNPGGQNLYSPYQHQTPGAQFNPYSFGGSGHPAIMSHLGFAAAYSNLGSMLPAYAAAAQLGAAHQQVLSNAHHPAGPETVGLNMTGGPSWMAYGGAQNPPRPPQQQKQIPPGFRYPQAAVTQPNDFVMGGGSQSAFRHAYFSREGGEMTDPANTLANLHHQQVLINNAAAQQQLRLTRNPVAPVQQQQQQPLLNRSQIGSQPDMKAPPVNNQPQQQFSNRPYGSDPNGASFDQTNPGNFGGISGSNSLDHPEIRPSMSDTNKSEGMSVIMPNFNFAGREVKPPASDYFQPSCR